jgi:hypothetical protein
MFTCDGEVQQNCDSFPPSLNMFSDKGENLTDDNSILEAADVSPIDTGLDSGIIGLSTE